MTRVARWRETGLALLAAALSAAASCADAPTAPPPSPLLRFEPPLLELGAGRHATVRLRNPGDGELGPIHLAAAGVRRSSGASVEGVAITLTPSGFGSLAPGGDALLGLAIDVPPGFAPGAYAADVEARIAGQRAARLEVGFAVLSDGPAVATVAITGGAADPRQGDVTAYSAEARDAAGAPVRGARVGWSVLPPSAGVIDGGGRFVGYEPGGARIMAFAGVGADTLEVRIAPRGVRRGGFEVVARGSLTSRFTSDLWVRGRAGYTGTWGFRGAGPALRPGDRLYAWDLADPARPVLTDSVAAEGAAVVNDVKIRSDGRLAVATIEFSSDNGFLLLDLADPLHPSVIRRFTPPELANGSGVHNTWIDRDHVYAVTYRLVTVDISTPSHPRVVSTFFGGSSFLHDVVVRDGLAILSHWDVGLVILDVGSGMAGGSPAAPVEVGRIDLPDYQVHNAWYWPAAGYVFLGDEVGIPGVMRVVDLRDPADPVAVASFTAAGAAPHNFWLDEERGILYLAWYENGIIALDVSGELRGELELQGREIARIRYAQGGRCPFNAEPASETCAFAPQLEDGLLYVADMNTGLWVLRPGF